MTTGRTRAFGLALLGLALACGGGGASAQTLRLACEEQASLLTPVVEAVLRGAGFSPETQVVPQLRLFTEMSRGRIDGTWLVSDAGIATIEGAVKVPVVLFKADFLAVTRDPALRITGPADLSGLRVAIVRGNQVHASLTRNVRNVESQTDHLSMFRMLQAGRVDVVIETRAAIGAFAHAAGLTDYLVVEPPLASENLYFCLGKAAEGYADRVTAAFRKALDSGEWMRAIAALPRQTPAPAAPGAIPSATPAPR